jgi:hypothetical protein
MEYRINTRIIILVAILVVVAIGLFTYTFVSAPAPEETLVTEEEPASQTEERIITARHQYLDGIHTVAGNASVPTTCHRLVPTPFIMEDGATVEIRFTTLLEGEECPAETMDVPFRVTFEAGENVTIRATWDGAPVRLNLVPLGPGETLEDDLYIKG